MKLIIILLTSIISLSAQQLSPESEAFITDFYQNEGKQHRSGLEAAQEIDTYTQLGSGAYQAIPQSDSKVLSVGAWRKSVVSGYRAEYALDKTSMTQLLSQGGGKLTVNVGYDSHSKMFHFSPKEKRKGVVKLFSSKDARRHAEVILTTQLSAFADELEFETIAHETMAQLPINASLVAEETEEVVRYGVRFRRVHNGGIVRFNLSFAEVWFDRGGNLEEIKLRWPEFTPKGEYQLQTLNEGLFELQGVLTEDLGANLGEVANSKVEGIALSWLPVKNPIDGVITLEPSYSYQVKIPLQAQSKNGKKSRVKYYDIRARLKR
ncbi:MAG: hypothetical protein OCD01_18745 [Fibrobacterales bacterium]